MTGQPPTDSSATDATSRRDRLAARRRRHVRVAAAVVGVLVVVAGGVGAYALYAKDPQANATPSEAKTQNFGEQGSLAPASAIRKAPPRKLDHDHPLRLWVGGDSLAGSFGPALGDQLGALGDVQTVIDFKVSSGLWSNDIRNWYDRAQQQMQTADPEAVVFIIGTNDTPVVNQVDANGDGTPDWEATYRLKVARMMDTLVGTQHRTVFWLGPPTLPDPGMNRGAFAMGEVMREEAAKRSADVVYLDTYKLFAKDGGYSRSIDDENGKTITARIPDGVHFTESGAAYLARAVFALLDTRWNLSKQADLLHPIGWNFTSASVDSVPGYSSRPTSRYRGRNGSSDTTAAPVAESTTFAPPTSVEPVATSVAVTAPPTTAAPPSTTPATSPPTTGHAPPTTLAPATP